MAIETNHNQVATKPADCPVILHISDLHFGRDKTKTEKQNRKLVLKLLGEKILDLGEGWRPSYLCITGDIADSGAAAEYDKAREWLLRFLEKLSIDISGVFMCPGNHDADQDIGDTSPKPESDEEVDNILSFPLPAHIEVPFANYSRFLEGLGVPRYSCTANAYNQSYLFGVSKVAHNLKFICCNSCFFSWDKKAKRKPMLGNSLLDHMQAEDLIEPVPDYATITVAIVHHPREQLGESECFSWSHRPAAFNRLAEMSHIILMGHEHAKVNPWDRSGYGAYFSCIGAAFYNIDHENSYQLFRINWAEQEYECKYFQWDPSHRKWLEVSGLRKNWPFDDGIRRGRPSATTEESYERKASRLADDLWTYIQGRDFDNARSLWQREKKWFAANKSRMSELSAEHIELCVEEIKSQSE